MIDSFPYGNPGFSTRDRLYAAPWATFPSGNGAFISG
jgi:hypothetical protein